MCLYPGAGLHQVAPYVGKMRPALARQLVQAYSSEGDVVLDPFCGSGTVALECRLTARHALAWDVNPYGCALTRAKLSAPCSLALALRALRDARAALPAKLGHWRRAPRWVQRFFHPRTLAEAHWLAEYLVRRRQYFLLGCLLGILHHERPGFLSFPAAHLRPYLRNRKYPPDQFPEAYTYRAVFPRLAAKVERVLASPPPPMTTGHRVSLGGFRQAARAGASVDAIITSPPYMNALDYARDNRLRMWFLGVADYRSVQTQELRRRREFESAVHQILDACAKALRPGGACVLVVGDSARSGPRRDVAELVLRHAKTAAPCFALAECRMAHPWPPHGTSRRSGGTTRETVIVLRRQ